MFNRKKNNIVTVLFLNFFALTVAVSFISNTQYSSIYLKILFSTGLLILSAFYIHINEKDPIKAIKTIFNRKIILFLSSFILLPSFACLYSVNQEYGVYKLLNILVISAPLIIVYAINVGNFNEKLNYYVKISAMIWAFFIVSMLWVLHPICINGVYHFSPNHWSHVITGRILFFLYLILLLFYIQTENRNERKVIFLCLLMLVSGINMSGLRTALLGFIFLTPIYLGIGYFRKKLSIKTIIFFLILMPLVGTITFAYEHQSTVKERMGLVNKISSGKLSEEGSFKGRMQSIQICWERFKEHPFRGIGFGGYYSPWKNYRAWVLKYPHNIILEYGVEMGILGLLWLFAVLWMIFSSTWKINPFLCLFFVGAFWMSLFSKDLSSNTLLVMGVVYYFVKPGTYYL